MADEDELVNVKKIESLKSQITTLTNETEKLRQLNADLGKYEDAEDAEIDRKSEGDDVRDETNYKNLYLVAKETRDIFVRKIVSKVRYYILTFSSISSATTLNKQ